MKLTSKDILTYDEKKGYTFAEGVVIEIKGSVTTPKYGELHFSEVFDVSGVALPVVMRWAGADRRIAAARAIKKLPMKFFESLKKVGQRYTYQRPALLAGSMPDVPLADQLIEQIESGEMTADEARDLIKVLEARVKKEEK